jgi:hypothetical protein
MHTCTAVHTHCTKQRAQEQAEAAADAAHIERLAAQRLLADLRFVTDTTTTTNTSNSNSNSSSVNGQHSGDVARRVTALSEQLRTAQLSALEAQRAAAALKRERRHLEAALTAKDEDIRALEDAHNAVQTRAVLTSGSSAAAAGGSGRGSGVCIDMVTLSPRGEHTGYSSGAIAASTGAIAASTGATAAGAVSGSAMHSARSELTAEERALLNEAMQPQQFDFGGLDPEQVLLSLFVYTIT